MSWKFAAMLSAVSNRGASLCVSNVEIGDDQVTRP